MAFLMAQTVKEAAHNMRDQGSTPGLGRFPGEGNGNSLQYSCLENSMDRGAWGAIQSMGSQRVRNNGVTDPFTFIFFTISATWERGVGDKGGEIGASVVYEGAGAI